MKIQTFNIVVGGAKCNAKCPYCVSKLTGCRDNLETQVIDLNVRTFKKACRFAQMSGVTTVLMTGKGEPTLYGSHIMKYLELLKEFDFPFIELQTNGIKLKDMDDSVLQQCLDDGLSTICLSAASYNSADNEEIFGDDINLWENVNRLHRIGFSVRISCVMVKGYIDKLNKVLEFARRCKIAQVEQFTARPVTNISIEEVCENKGSEVVQQWIEEHSVSPIDQDDIRIWFEDKKNATKLLELAHGAAVYDVAGQNISINSCLTRSTDPDQIRQLIYFPDGHLRYDWVKQGAIIL